MGAIDDKLSAVADATTAASGGPTREATAALDFISKQVSLGSFAEASWLRLNGMGQLDAKLGLKLSLLTNLARIELSNVPALADKDFQTLLRACPALVALRVTGPVGLSELAGNTFGGVHFLLLPLE